MTVVVGLAPGERVPPAVNLGAMLARSECHRLVVAAVVPEPWPPHPFRSDEEFLAFQANAAEQALTEARAQIGDGLTTDYVLRRARSVASGLLAVAEENDASCIVLGSSANGALNRVSLGGAAARILHSSGVPVTLAPRGFDFRPACRVSRVTVAFGRGDGDSDLLAAAADRAAAAEASLRVVCFAVQPVGPTAVAGEAAAEGEGLVTDRWVKHLEPIIAGTLERTSARRDRVEIVVGQGPSWSAALSDVRWQDDEILVIGTSSSSVGRLFLGSHATKIVRASPVPVMLVPRSVVKDHP